MAADATPPPQQSDRLHLLYDVTRRLATFTDLDDLVRYATRRTRELFEAEGCALILLDRARNELTFPIASQRESGTISEEKLAEIRFPADRGIAGWVLKHDEAALVADTSTDERFYGGVDRRTSMQTRSLLCAPLRSAEGRIGVIEVVNPDAGCLNAESLEFLEALANEIAVAHEKASLYAQLRGEVLNLRRICRVAGFSLLSIGVLLAAGTALVHRARVLPWWQLPAQRGILVAAVLAVAGVVLVAAARDRLASAR